MFSIEHEFDATVVTIEQPNAQNGRVQKITLSMTQLHDLRAAFNLPEGVYTLTPGQG